MSSEIRHDWRREELLALLDLPFPELLFRAAAVHREHFDPAQVQVSTLLSVKTGGCPEDCGYCPQAQRYQTGVDATKLMDAADVLEKARQAKAAGASRFCMGAAWRSPKDRDIPKVAEMIAGVKAMGLETCATLGMLSPGQAHALRDAGLDYYNHNLDTAPEFYGDVIQTRQYQDRLDTLEHVRDAAAGEGAPQRPRRADRPAARRRARRDRARAGVRPAGRRVEDVRVEAHRSRGGRPADVQGGCRQ